MAELPEDLKNRIIHVGVTVGDQTIMGSDTMLVLGQPFAKAKHLLASIPILARKPISFSVNSPMATR